MNAYDLADEFKNRNWDEVDCVLWCGKAANMLRQQADELDKVVPQLVKANGLIENLRLRIAELEKDLHMVQRHYDQLNTQTKPLSNDEIREIGEDCELKNNGILNWIDFARAILRKAGEK